MLERPCAHCAKLFVDKNRLLRNSGAPTRYCSSLCRRRAASKRRYARLTAEWRDRVQSLSPEGRQAAARITSGRELAEGCQPASALVKDAVSVATWANELESL